MNRNFIDAILQKIEDNYLFINEEERNHYNSSLKSFREKSNINLDDLKKFIANLNDPHTFIVEKKFDYLYICDFIWDNDKLYLLDNNNLNIVPKEVVSINDCNIQKLIDIYAHEYRGLHIANVKMLLLQDIKSCHIEKFSKKTDLIVKSINNDLNLYKKTKVSEYLKSFSISKESFNDFKPIISKKIDNETIMIKILGFNFDDINELLCSEINRCNEYKNIIFDIRHNAGGSITNTKKVASLFSNSTINLNYSVQIEDKIKIPQKIGGKVNILENKKVFVFINEFTMSSAEFIFTIALKNSDNDVITIGRKSAGMKNQAKIFPITNEISIQITVKKYVDFLNEYSNGILPDKVVNCDYREPYITNDYYLDTFYEIKNID